MVFSLGEWVQRRSIFTQIYFDQFTRISPYIAGYFMIIYYYLATRPETLYEYMNMLSIPLVVMAVGSLIMENYRRSRINEVSEYEAVNIDFWWTPNYMMSESNIISEANILKEREIEDPKLLPEALRPYAGLLKAVKNHDVRYGKYFYEVVFDREMLDHHDKPWRHALFLCPFPGPKIFRKIPQQLMLHKGTVFMAPTGSISAMYCNEFTEIGDNYRVFKVAHSPEHVYSFQLGLGLISEDLAKSDVNEAAQLAIDHKATKYAMQAREAEGQTKAIMEGGSDTLTKTYEDLEFLWTNRRRILEGKKRLDALKTRKAKIIYVIIAVIVGYWLLRYFNYI